MVDLWPTRGSLHSTRRRVGWRPGTRAAGFCLRFYEQPSSVRCRHSLPLPTTTTLYPRRPALNKVNFVNA